MSFILYKLFRVQEKLVMWQLSRQCLSRHQLNRKRKMKFFEKIFKAPLNLEWTTLAIVLLQRKLSAAEAKSVLAIWPTKLERTNEKATIHFSRIFISISLMMKKTRSDHDSNPTLGYKANLFTSRPTGKQSGRCKEKWKSVSKWFKLFFKTSFQLEKVYNPIWLSLLIARLIIASVNKYLVRVF